jgi:hypothetical protein
MSNRTWLIGVLCLTACVGLNGCTPVMPDVARPRAHQGGSPSGSLGPSRPEGIPLPEDQGPFGGLTWHPRAVGAGSLLHDDGSHLWAYRPTGIRSLIWSHPPASVYELAADVYGRTIAVVVGSRAIEGAYLYLLAPDGSVDAIRRVSNGWDIWVPIFAKAPTRPRGPTRIYWTEHSADGFDPATDTPIMRVMTLDGDRVKEVSVPLLWGQAPWRLDAYPGNSTMSLTLFRRSNVPTYHEVLRNEDLVSGGSDSSPTELGYWQQIANTDSEAGVAWLSPDTYVVQVGKSDSGDGAIGSSSLVLYRVGCEFEGGETLWSGSTIDPGTFHPYPLLAPDARHVLVLEQAPGRGTTPAAKGWASIDVGSGDLSPSPVHWAPGPWASVRAPAKATDEGPSCRGFEGTWP